VPESVSVVLSEETLVVTLHGARRPVAGREGPGSPQPRGAAQVQEFHRQLFATSSTALR
jgi:hypothetical protein